MIANTSLPRSSACAALEIPRSRYYRWQAAQPLHDSDADLRAAIHKIALEFPGYGYRRVAATLYRQGQLTNHKRILRVMREEHLLCKCKSYKPRTTNSNHEEPLYPNLTKGLVVTRLNQLWVADITFVGIVSCWLYLAVIIDVFSRKVIGWALSRHIDAQLCLDALDKALNERRQQGFDESFEGLIHHSDRGVQYASHAYIKRLKSIGALPSMTETGNPRENAFAESFFKNFKVEEVYLKEYITFDDAHQNIKQFIEDVFNAKRLHSSIGYRPPNELEAEVLNIR